MILPALRRIFASTSTDDENSDWMTNVEFLGSNGVFFKDFIPVQDPDGSTCCQKRYITFGETVQNANEWLANQDNYEIVNCECLLFSTCNQDPVIPDTWPTGHHLRGLRVWIRNASGNETEAEQQGTGKMRYLISYRDFSPVFNKKSMFNKKYEDTNVLLERMNTYLADRTTAARVISLQTLDTPMEGNLLDVDVDTEKSLLSFSQHGFTRYCRSLRLFSVTQYKRGTLAMSVPQPKMAFRDFVPNHSTAAGHEVLSDVMKRALQWCSENHVTLLNVQVLSLRASEHSTASSTWLLESPGHIPNKFTSFIRLAYVALTDPIDSLLEEATTEIAPVEENDAADETKSNGNEEAGESESISDEDKNDINVPNGSETDVANMPGMLDPTEKIFESKTLGLIHCKIFIPRLVAPGAFCKKSEWETMDQTLERLNFWVSASQGNVLTIHTQYVYIAGNEVDPEDTYWARHMTGGRQIPVLQVVVVDGRPPTALPPHPMKGRSKCSIM